MTTREQEERWMDTAVDVATTLAQAMDPDQETLQVWACPKVMETEPEDPGGGWWVQAWIWVPGRDVIGCPEQDEVEPAVQEVPDENETK